MKRFTPYVVGYILFMAGVLVGSYVHSARGHDPYHAPHTAPQLVDRIRSSDPTLCIIPAANLSKDLDQGFYVCTATRTWDDVSALHSHSPREKWNGVVMVVHNGHGRLNVDQWGGLIIKKGPFIIIGDSDLAHQIVLLIR
jgi:hypothetical protein